MNNRNSVALIFIQVLLILGLLSSGCGVEKLQELNRPSVIYIVADACRADHLSCYGHYRETSPEIDKIAERGILFENFFTQASNTLHSMAQILTSRYFTRPVSDMFEPMVWLKSRPSTEANLFRLFNRAGYHTCFITSQPYLMSENDIATAVDEYHFVEADLDDPYAEFEMAIDTVFKWLDDNHEKPFFLYLHVMDPHLPHYLINNKAPYNKFIPKGEKERLRKFGRYFDIETFDPTDRETVIGQYDGEILYSDKNVGMVWDKLAELGIQDDVIFIVSADHGEDLGEYKTWGHTHIEGDIMQRVPFIITFPRGQFGRGVRIGKAVEAVDMLPTLLDFIGIQKPHGTRFDGTSMLPLLNGRPQDYKKDKIFGLTTIDYHGDSLAYSVRTDEYRLVVGEFSRKADNDPRGQHEKRLCSIKNPTEMLSPEEEDNAAVITDLENYYSKELRPSREEYASQGARTDGIGMANIITNNIEDMHRVVHSKLDREAFSRDGRWQLKFTHLIAHCDKEDVPEIGLSFDVPKGVYRVYLQAASRDDGDITYSRFLCKAMDETEFHLVSTKLDSPKKRQYVLIGKYRIGKDNKCSLIIAPADKKSRIEISRAMFMRSSPKSGVKRCDIRLHS